MRDDVTFDPAQQSTESPGSYTRTTEFEVRTTRLDDDRSDFDYDYDYRSGPEADDDAGVAVRLGQALMIVSGAALVALAARQGTRRFRSGSEAEALDRGRTDEWSGALRAHAEDTGAAAPIQTAVTIGRPTSEVYAFWRRLENLPRFMNNVESVTETGDGRSHWVAKSPLGFRVEWDAEIVEEQEGRLLSWRSLPGAQVHNAGTVHFEEAPGDRGTVVRVSFEYRAASGIGQAIGKVLKPITKQEVREDLRRLKMLLETEEIPTIEGQTHGTRSLIGRIHNPF
ncbi:MAG TPA: SRPBCC family protein [Thermoanaerobaculia bacterium]|nr:SRPBCC family protein [Thermoanaerobaculia bacterium]